LKIVIIFAYYFAREEFADIIKFTKFISMKSTLMDE